MNLAQAPLSPEHSRDQTAESSRSRRLLGFLAWNALLALAFIRPLTALAMHAAGEDTHSHVFLIPFISAYLIYIRRNQLPKDYMSSLAWALIPLSFGVASLVAVGSLARMTSTLSENDFLALMTFSFVCLIASGGFLFLGREWMAAVSFPFAFLIFMVPLPDAILNLLESISRLASAEAAALLFSISGIPVLRDGTVFHLPGIVIEVAQECSGIRSSWVLFITSLLTSYLFLKSPWRRAILVSLVIPLAILRNGLRILVIGVLCVQFGPQMINSVIHHRGGPLFFALSLVLLLLLLWWLRRGEIAAGSVSSPERLAPSPRT
jgi:exosortase C (VPDSG-CTERM-specific)